MRELLALAMILALAISCGPPAYTGGGDDDDDDDVVDVEGDAPGECDDGVDNDQDGLTDCVDPSCLGDEDCGGGDDDDTTGTTEPDGPEVLDLQVNPSTLTEGGQLVFTATVTDPDGTDDILAGQLTSHGGAVFHGGFTQISGGSFTYQTSWNQLDGARTIEFEGQDVWTFTATFQDTAGHEGTKGVQVTLSCGGSDACGGDCGYDLETDQDNCGACGNPCDQICSGGQCTAPDWVDMSSQPGAANCGSACGQQGDVCVDPYDCVDMIGYPQTDDWCIPIDCEVTFGEILGEGECEDMAMTCCCG